MSIAVQVKRGVAANRPTLLSGEFYFATDTSQLWVGPTPALINSGGSAADIAQSLRAPSGNESITAGSSAVIVRRYTVASGMKMSLGAGSALRIL